jgi:hypothetical protein
MWILIPAASSDEEDWVGRLEAKSRQSTEWDFELVRRIAPNRFSFDDGNPFKGAYTVGGLLDFTDDATLILPHALNINTAHGKFGSGQARIKIAGRAHGLLKGLQVLDGDEKLFTRIEFESELFALWNSTGIPDATGTVPDANITNIGMFQFKAYSAPSGPDKYSILLTLNEPTSLREAIELCVSFEALVGFLIGNRPQLPIFRLFAQKGGPRGRLEVGQLEIGYQKHHDDELRNVFTAIHLRSVDNTEFSGVLKKFYADRDRLVGLIHSIEYVRLFSNNVDDNFRLIVPLLEEGLGSFRNEDELSFIGVKERFFSYIDKVKDREIDEFCKKHINVVASKAPSIKTLIERAVRHYNSKGFCFKAGLGERIQKKRGAMFHSMKYSDGNTVLLTYEEGNVAAAILMLKVFEELGISVSALARRRNAFDGMLRVCFDTVKVSSTGS